MFNPLGDDSPAKMWAIIRRNATHCISLDAIVMCVCACACACARVCVRVRARVRACVCVCVCVCVVSRLWTSGKRFEIKTSFFFKLLGMTPDITYEFYKNRIRNSKMADKMAAVKHYNWP